MGFQRLDSDSYLYINKEKHVYVLIYVDGPLTVAPSKNAYNKISRQLREQFKMTELNGQFFLEIEFTWNENKTEVRISQEEYIDKMLNIFGMTDCNPVKTPMDRLSLCICTLGKQRFILYKRLFSQTLLNAACTSKNTEQQYFLYSSELKIVLVTRWSWSIDDCCIRNPNWWSGMVLFSSKMALILASINFSSILLSTGSRLIG